MTNIEFQNFLLKEIEELKKFPDNTEIMDCRLSNQYDGYQQRENYDGERKLFKPNNVRSFSALVLLCDISLSI